MYLKTSQRMKKEIPFNGTIHNNCLIEKDIIDIDEYLMKNRNIKWCLCLSN